MYILIVITASQPAIFDSLPNLKSFNIGVGPATVEVVLDAICNSFCSYLTRIDENPVVASKRDAMVSLILA